MPSSQVLTQVCGGQEGLPVTSCPSLEGVCVLEVKGRGWLPQRLLAARLGLGLAGLWTGLGPFIWKRHSCSLPGDGWWQAVLLDPPRQLLGTRAGQACVGWNLSSASFQLSVPEPVTEAP